jgi:6-hydroxy-3-succinoylpyridine 3-monooxygenase
MSDSKPNAIVYVDGFNWYHAIFKHRPEWKWLNVQTFFEALRPHENIKAIKFFTAIVDEHLKESDARERHLKYISALKTLDKVTIILGIFQMREVSCRSECKNRYMVPEEKKTDVNIAVEIMSDAFNNNCDSIILVSGDSDAQPPIQWVHQNYSAKKITVYIPALPPDREKRRLDFYNRIGIDCKFLPTDGLSAHQLRPVVHLPDSKVVCRPASWCAPV